MQLWLPSWSRVWIKDYDYQLVIIAGCLDLCHEQFWGRGTIVSSIQIILFFLLYSPEQLFSLFKFSSCSKWLGWQTTHLDSIGKIWWIKRKSPRGCWCVLSTLEELPRFSPCLSLLHWTGEPGELPIYFVYFAFYPVFYK